MTLWEDVRRQARGARAKSGLHELVAAEALLGSAAQQAGLVRVGVPSGHPLLYGAQAVLDRDQGVIWFDQSVDPLLARFYQAHELGHLYLHSNEVLVCDAAALDVEAAEEPAQTGVRRVEGYSPAERREREANVFAREFLLPTSLLRHCYRADGHDARTIAAETGLPDSLVVAQLSRALLTPELSDGAAATEPSEAADLRLDPSQKEAAQVARGPFLLEAGPGTGKTRTLVARVLHLIDQGVQPSSILALTFSNKAAEEMRARVAVVAPEAAPRIWMGTFHAFGLELLRKYGTRLGLPPRPEVVDPIAALGLLEEGLPELQLEYYQNLYDPTLFLRDIISAISRAKDEHVGPERYTVLAQRMRDRADSSDEKDATRAEKVLEVARVYTWYQAQLQTRGQVDFGDLIARSIDLLRANVGLRASLRRQYRHVLVDEYQDVNRASGLLLRELAGDGAGLWVVGDARQAIYRFRGASPINMRRFGQDFPGAAVQQLGFNYRSQEPIVETVATFGRTMQLTGTPSWEPVRGHTDGEVLLRVAEDGDAEGDGIAREIHVRHAAGTSYRDQAVLCRSHTVLARVAARLEAAGVPVLYLGDLFERPEIRDLLSLLSLAAGDARGLVRVAEFPEYRIPLADVRALLALARERDEYFPRAFRLIDECTLSADGRRGLELLRDHLSGITFGTDAWKLLVRYLFERGGYVRHLLDHDSINAQQQRLAMYQFLGFLQDLRDEFPASDRHSLRNTLRAIRRLELFGEEQNLRQVPDWASGIDAVRLMTVHAAKGLEFRAVYLPWLGKSYFPSTDRSPMCPPPDGLIEEEYLVSSEDEEECLFFVGLSRARDFLCLSRAERYLTQKKAPSEFLARLITVLGSSEIAPVWTSNACNAPVKPLLRSSGPRPTFKPEVLKQYNDCPRQYYYQYELGLGGRREDVAYVQFHNCVYTVLHWLQDERGAGRNPDEHAALEKLYEVWHDRGPKDHVYEPEYRRIAELMLRRATGEAWRPPRRTDVQPKWEVRLAHGDVSVAPDRVVEDGDQLVLQRLRTGKPSQDEARADIYALYQEAAARVLPGVEARIETLYLATGEIREVQVSEKSARTRLGHYEAAIEGILRREFPPAPNDRRCPRCPHYFICPAGGESFRSDVS